MTQFTDSLIIKFLLYLVTPPGTDSRLTRAMKAYHLGKAREPTDLPTWLFTEQERRAVRGAMLSTVEKDADSFSTVVEVSAVPQRTGLRDIYDNAAQTTNPVLSRAPTRTRNGDTTAPSRATNRLKELRDAKRSAIAANSRNDVDEQNGYYERRGENSDGANQTGGRVSSSQSQRIGLPSRPRTVRRV